MKRTAVQRRRAAMYAVALGSTLVVTVVGMTALMAVRVERLSAEATGDLDNARFYAQSAIDGALWQMNYNTTWRSTFPSGRWKTDQVIGQGKYTLDAVDPIDNDLTDSKTESVRLTATATSGKATYLLKATAVSQPKPLDALSRALTSNGNFSTVLGITFLASGGAVHVNGNLSNLAIINANVEVGSVLGLGTILGSLVNPAPALEMPDPGVFALYQSIATTIGYTGDIDRATITAGMNPWGANNPDGVYYINSGASSLTIKRSRINGTLVVSCNAGKKLIIDDPVFWQPYRSDYPALISDCDVQIKLTSVLGSLSELLQGTNYNPTGAPYAGVTDSDQLDTYADEIQGLVHVKRNLSLDATSRVRGVIICEGAVSANAAEIIYTASWGGKTPMGYHTYAMGISPGTWERAVLP